MTRRHPEGRGIADAARRRRHVFVRDLELEAAIGVWRHEHGRRQRVRINLDAAVAEGETPPADELTDVVCYQRMIDAAKDIVGQAHVKLAETLAERIAAACLADPRVLAIRVRVEKPDAVEEAASVGIEIERLQRRHGPPPAEKV
ncbi:MAG TPA: dihydroneopterin aldolase [Candidatus Sulfotelmatobacter sp.]|nr:dihydroneopterin aldolase [Candidatus Sulfotelmatobacter sp.]